MATSDAQNLLPLSIKDKAALCAAYMPFVKNGGLFLVQNDIPYKLGDEVFMLITLMDSSEEIPVAGKVVWITPKGALGGRKAGIGIQFGEKDEGATKDKIEGYLAGSLESDKSTHTM